MAKIIGGTASTSMLVPDFHQNNPHKSDFIKNNPYNIDKHAFACGDGANAIGNYSVAFGVNTIAGTRGYYIQNIDFKDKKIYLSKTKTPQEDFPDEFLSVFEIREDFETPAYEIGDCFSIIDSDHHILTATIAALSNNVVTYTGELGFDKFTYDPDANGNTFVVPSKPLVGEDLSEAFIGGIALGDSTTAIGVGSAAFGSYTMAAGDYAVAEGLQTVAGYAAHAEGHNVKALGPYSHAEGKETEALGRFSHAEGWLTHAIGERSHAEGCNTKASGTLSHAEGNQTTASGNFSHSEGASSVASADYSHAEGNGTQASGVSSHAEGAGSQSANPYSHAEGFGTKAQHSCAHSEGNQTTASGYASHSEGKSTTASGDYSHAEGEGSVALHSHSHAGGIATKTGCAGQMVVGRYNKVVSDALFVVGNGTDDSHRSNAFEAKKDGSVVIGGIHITAEKLAALLKLVE